MEENPSAVDGDMAGENPSGDNNSLGPFLLANASSEPYPSTEKTKKKED